MKFVFQFKDGTVSATQEKLGKIRVFGQVHGPRERAEFTITKADAKDLQKWFNILWPDKSKPTR